MLICRGEILELDRLQSDIMREVDTFQSLITRRMTSATTLTSSDLDSTSDLGTLGVIHEVSVWMVLGGFSSDAHTCTCTRLLRQAPICLFFSGRSPAYSGLQRVGRQQAQCACPWERGGELVGVCSVCATCRGGGLSRRE